MVEPKKIKPKRAKVSLRGMMAWYLINSRSRVRFLIETETSFFSEFYEGYMPLRHLLAPPLLPIIVTI